MNDTRLANEPHRRYLARSYAEARQWRRGLPQGFDYSRVALNSYIKSLRECWLVERRWEATFADFYKRVDAQIALNH